jgi:hypothetical protein
MAARGGELVSILTAMWKLPLALAMAGLNVVTRPLGAAVPGTGQTASPGTTTTPPAPGPNLVEDTFNALIAFVVPGPDPYSVAQGVSTTELGGIDAGVTDALIAVFDLAQPHPPQGPLPSETIAGLLNQVAQKVNPSAPGSFASPFARLSFAEKTAVFQFLQEDPSMAPYRRLAGLLLFIPAAATYSEGGAFDVKTRRVVGWPVGWAICRYTGAADGRDEFKGYFQGRREALRTSYAERSSPEEDDADA